MKLTHLATIAICLFTSLAWADGHFVAPESWSEQPLSPHGLEQRIERAAATYQGYGEVARIALFDIAFPADEEEYRALDGYAVLLVAALSQSEDELPPQRVFLRLPNSAIELRLLAASCSASIPDSLVRKVLGPNRWEGLYLFPVAARLSNAELRLDFAAKRRDFVLTRFDGTEALANLPIQEPTAPMPREEPLRKIVLREFPGFVSLLSSHPSAARQ